MFDSAENEVISSDLDSVVRNTEWFNPTEDTVVLELHVATPSNTRKVQVARGDKPLTFREKTGKVKYMIGPKKTAFIPSEYDSAIQVVRDGVIQSGLGPQLVNKGYKEAPKMHHALDVERAEKQAALTEAQMAFKAKAEAEARTDRAMERIAELEKLLGSATDPHPSPVAQATASSPSTVPLPKKKD